MDVKGPAFGFSRYLSSASPETEGSRGGQSREGRAWEMPGGAGLSARDHSLPARGQVL